MNDFLRTVWNGVKKIGLATFYGLRQCMLQLLCWEIFEVIVNRMGFYLYGYHPAAFTIRWSIYLCIVVFTMLYHWGAMIIPSKERFARFVIPYIICVVGWLDGTVIAGIVVPFICLLFFLLENYLKKVLTHHPKAFKRIKIAYSCIFFTPLLLTALVRIDKATDVISRKRRFDDAKTLTRITETSFPKFKVVEYKKGRTGFNGDYRDELVLEFKEMPSEEFYTTLESLADRGNANIVEKDSVDGNLYFTESYYKQTYWNIKNDSTYYYSRVWGNGLPAPPGEDGEEDMSLNIQIKRGARRFDVSYGAW